MGERARHATAANLRPPGPIRHHPKRVRTASAGLTEQQEDDGIEQLPGLLGQERRLLGMVAATILNVIPATKAAMNLLPSAAAAV